MYHNFIDEEMTILFKFADLGTGFTAVIVEYLAFHLLFVCDLG